MSVSKDTGSAWRSGHAVSRILDFLEGYVHSVEQLCGYIELHCAVTDKSAWTLFYWEVAEMLPSNL